MSVHVVSCHTLSCCVSWCPVVWCHIAQCHVMLHRAASHVALYVANFYFLVSLHDVEQVWPVRCNACVSDSSCLNLATVFTSQDSSHSSFLFCCLAPHMLLFCNLDLFRFVRNSWFVCVAFASAFFVCSRCVFVTPFLMFVNFPRCQVRCLCHNFGPAWTTWYHTFWRLGRLQPFLNKFRNRSIRISFQTQLVVVSTVPHLPSIGGRLTCMEMRLSRFDYFTG